MRLFFCLNIKIYFIDRLVIANQVHLGEVSEEMETTLQCAGLVFRSDSKYTDAVGFFIEVRLMFLHLTISK